MGAPIPRVRDDRARPPARVGNAPSRVPGSSARSPRFKSSPSRRICAPTLGTVAKLARSPSRVTSSCITTASAPSGSPAPVKMRAEVPAASGEGDPAHAAFAGDGQEEGGGASKRRGRHRIAVHGACRERRERRAGTDFAREHATYGLRSATRSVPTMGTSVKTNLRASSKESMTPS